ncbi:hypothetical protein SAMN05421788_103115 [Filimonas lacunae]|uniref:Uncharacterized protein n=1 Tax=Filimonas lacunae TaxID=477680 RepID=A0A173MJF7_9BACT|nr:hypothetical protein [Filimonas lacunae]BAV07765.1 hypothetical protein FLA_3796 [Filimonas lacunae]SIT04501.1 hypothetical protein SAMN05421788_103115 [Filimonas lacunae]
MKLKLLFFYSFVLFTSLTQAQRSLSKEEILKEMIKNGDVKNTSGDSAISALYHLKVVNLKAGLEKLRERGVDTFACWVETYPGIVARDSCGAPFVKKAYILWAYGGSFFAKRLINNCEFEETTTAFASELFDYYKQNSRIINQEYVMPLVYSGEIRKDSSFRYEGAIVFHETQYYLYLQSGSVSKLINVAKSFFTDEKSIFYKDNLNAKWFRLFNKAKEVLKSL